MRMRLAVTVIASMMVLSLGCDRNRDYNFRNDREGEILPARIDDRPGISGAVSPRPEDPAGQRQRPGSVVDTADDTPDGYTNILPPKDEKLSEDYGDPAYFKDQLGNEK
jgi:hypothetical protein